MAELSHGPFEGDSPRMYDVIQRHGVHKTLANLSTLYPSLKTTGPLPEVVRVFQCKSDSREFVDRGTGCLVTYPDLQREGKLHEKLVFTPRYEEGKLDFISSSVVFIFRVNDGSFFLQTGGSVFHVVPLPAEMRSEEKPASEKITEPQTSARGFLGRLLGRWRK